VNSLEVPPRFRHLKNNSGELSLANEGLHAIPDWLQRFTTLTMLDLSGNYLTTVPEWLGNLKGLTALNLSNNRLGDPPVPPTSKWPTASTGPWQSRPGSVAEESSGSDVDVPEGFAGQRTDPVTGKKVFFIRKSETELIQVPEDQISAKPGATSIPEAQPLTGFLPELIKAPQDQISTKPGATSIPEAQPLTDAWETTSPAWREVYSETSYVPLPESLGNLTALTTLNLAGNRLTSLPESLGNLTALTTFNLAGNRLTSLPESLGNLTALTTLNLDGSQQLSSVYSLDLNQFGALGLDDVYHQTPRYNQPLNTLHGEQDDFTTINESSLFEVQGSNRLTALPESLGKLCKLTTLNVSHHKLTSLPKSLGNLTALATLDLGNNQLTGLPESLGSLTALTTLDLGGNQLAGLPESLGSLTKLTTLDLARNQLAGLPESLGNLTALTTLNLAGNRLTSLPDSLGNLAALTTLNLDGSRQLDSPDISSLTAIQLMANWEPQKNSTTATTSLLNKAQDGNRLTALPESLGKLSKLTTLNVSHHKLTSLPKSLGDLATLTRLDLGSNQLATLPESLGSLTKLTTLNLNSNQLTAVPLWLRDLTTLTEVNMTRNQITTLPRQLSGRLSEGLQLKLAENPLADPLPELVARGTAALVAYLDSLEDAVAQYEAKLLLVGEGNVGKTSLVAAFSGAPFIEGRPTTHGIEISPLSFRHPDIDLEMTLRAWDFGGQEVYRVTHQFFFSRRALYLIVWNAREGQEQNEVEGWLRRIKLRVGPATRVMVVATHCEERLPELDYPHLEQTFSQMLVGNFEVDSRTGVGLPELREAISRQAAELPQMGQLISPRWVAAREEILARAEVEPQIRYEEFAEICERCGLAGEETITLAQLMHDLGQIIYYAEDEGLKEIVVLNPEWLTKAISYVLEDKHTKDAGGILDHARLRSIWQDRDNGPAYRAHYHPYFLRLMEKFDISYRLEGDELRSLVAQLVPHERPALPWRARTQPPQGIRTLALTCRLSDSVPGLIPWLTVRHHRASTGKHWRRGVFLRHPIPAYASEALLELRPSAELRHSVELAVEVRAPSPDLYFNVLRDSIEDLITRRWPGLHYELFVPCPGKVADISMCSGEFPLEGLARLREKGRTVVPCMKCGDEYEISFLLTGFTVPVQPLDAQVRQQLDRIESSVVRVEGRAAEIADSVRHVLRVVSTEVDDCPRLFTLTQQRPAGFRRLRAHKQYYRLTLWCEHPGYWHPWLPAAYELDPPREWFLQIKPYAMLILKTLQLGIPLAGSVADVLLPQDQFAQARGYLKLMKTLISDLHDDSGQDLDGADLGKAANQLTAAEGAALRALRVLLFNHDQQRTFGGLRRTVAPSGDLLWVCRDHYPEYDPGLPKVP
jgi:internalin A